MSKDTSTTPVSGVTPVPDWESQPYWEAAKEGRLLVKRCRVCGRTHWYPRAHCPYCLADDTEWVDSTGRGTISTYTVIRQNRSRAFREWGEYALGMVELVEGARVFSMIRGDLGNIRIGAEVTVGFEPVGDAVAPVFDVASDRS